MILVIADDLSGAAELAGLAALRGCTAEVHTRLDPSSNAGMIALDTQTRPLLPSAAAERLASILREARAIRPDWIYKKTDSVLRGNIRAELEVFLKFSADSRILFIPANPGRQRCIRQGRYFVNDKPLNETVFAEDPVHPQRSARVLEALGTGNVRLHSIRRDEAGPQEGIVIPDIESRLDLTRRAAEVDARTLPAGAAEFFDALLERRCSPRTPIKDTLKTDARSLFVCGSLAAWDQNIAATAALHGVPVFALLPELPNMEDMVDTLKRTGKAMLCIGRSGPGAANASVERLKALVELGTRLAERAHVNRLLLEGGATASAFIAARGWTRFLTVPADLPGVGCLKPHGTDCEVLIKPGSYPWPDGVWTGQS